MRNIPDRLHRKLTRRARSRGQTLTTFVEEVLEREVSRPTPEELAARIRSRSPVDFTTEDIVDAIREDRGPLPTS